MKLTLESYRDKLLGCFTGKNIGGTLGAPFECHRGVWNLDYYTHDISKGVLPNDDLDLQLVFLNAIKKFGRDVDSHILSEYWLSFIVANWSEYGAGKNNLSQGLLPPISGRYENPNKDSCGAFIRSEIWACLNPGHPEKAVQYAYEDATVDHADEGVYAEIFCAALESAAFCESDMHTLINIALSYIPENCDISKAVNCALECHRQGIGWKAARKRILNIVPGSFGMLLGYKDMKPEPDVPVGPMGYDAPSNIGLMIIGWIYGEGDFSKSICIAAGCGEDADCTAGTLASVMGIISGLSGIDNRWTDPIGNEIKTISINVADTDGAVPQTTEQLVDELVSLMPEFMYGYYDVSKQTITCSDNLYCKPERINSYRSYDFRKALTDNANSVHHKSLPFDTFINYSNSINILPGEKKKLHITFENNLLRRQWLELNWTLPTCVHIEGGNSKLICLPSNHGEIGRAETDVILCFDESLPCKIELILSVSSSKCSKKILIPVMLLKK